MKAETSKHKSMGILNSDCHFIFITDLLCLGVVTKNYTDTKHF